MLPASEQWTAREFRLMNHHGCSGGFILPTNLLMSDFIHITKISWTGDIRTVTTIEAIIAVAPTHMTLSMTRAIRNTALYSKVPHVINGNLEGESNAQK